MPSQTPALTADRALIALLAEMHALMRILPAKTMPSSLPIARGSGNHIPHETEDAIEAGFDNMPV